MAKETKQKNLPAAGLPAGTGGQGRQIQFKAAIVDVGLKKKGAVIKMTAKVKDGRLGELADMVASGDSVSVTIASDQQTFEEMAAK